MERTPEFMKACHEELPASLRAAILKNKASVHDAAWLQVFRNDGAFEFSGAASKKPGLKPAKLGGWEFHPLEMPSISALAHALRLPSFVIYKTDPLTGHELEGDGLMLNMIVPGDAFCRVVKDIVRDFIFPVQTPSRPAAESTDQPAKKWPGQVAKEGDLEAAFRVNAAILLSVSLAIGDFASSKILLQRCPEAVSVPLMIGITQSKRSTDEWVTPAYVCEKFNRYKGLELLAEAGWKTSDPVYSKVKPRQGQSINASQVPNRLTGGASQISELELLDTPELKSLASVIRGKLMSETVGANGVKKLPAMVVALSRCAKNEGLQAARLAEPAEFSLVQTSFQPLERPELPEKLYADDQVGSLHLPSSSLRAGENHETTLKALSDMASSYVDGVYNEVLESMVSAFDSEGLFDSVIDSVTSRVATGCHGSENLFDRFKDRINWAKFTGEFFPPVKAAEEWSWRPGENAVAEERITSLCVLCIDAGFGHHLVKLPRPTAGCDVLTDPENTFISLSLPSNASNGRRPLISPLHVFAQHGLIQAMKLALQEGASLDSQKSMENMDSEEFQGMTALQIAKACDQHEAVNFLMATKAKKVALGALLEISSTEESKESKGLPCVAKFG